MKLKMSFSRSSRLSRKRKNDDSQPESSQFDITVDDFQEDGPVFRLPPKRTKQDKVPNPRGRSKKVDTDIENIKNNDSKSGNSRQKKNTEEIPGGKKASSVKKETNESQSKESENRIIDLDDDSLFKKPSLVNKLHKKAKHTSNKDSDISQNDINRNNKNEILSNHFDDADKDKDLLELEKSICTSYEKLCHCCKHIVPSSVFTDHLKDCMQKFKHNTRATRSTANTSENSAQDSKTIKEIENEVEIRKEQSETKKCQICSKIFKYSSERIGHVKGCALKHGITIEELNQATGKNRKTINQNKDNKTKKSRSKKASSSELVKDPDLAIALALSRSLAEDEADKRSHEEEKLLALGLDDIVQEDRKKRPIAVLKQPPDKPQKAEKSTKRKKRGTRSETVLMQRSISDRERIISEKVAMLLAVDDNPAPTWDPQKNFISKHCLAAYQDQGCSLWESSHCTSDEPLDRFYVQELVTYIKPQNIEVGGLFKRLSQIPGRLNATASLEDSDSDDGYQELDVECSVAEAYRTQLILAELMGSQEGLDFTVDEVDERGEINVSQTAKSGFLFMHNKSTESESVTNNSKIDMLPEDRNDISNNVGSEIKIHNDKDSPSPLNTKESNIAEIASKCNSGNKTHQMNEDGNRVHFLQNQTESKVNKTNKDSPLSPIKKPPAVPIIIQETEIIDVPDDDDDNSPPTFELNMDVNLNSSKDKSPKTGWITRTKENNSLYKNKSPCANNRNVSNFKSPKSIDTPIIEERKIKLTDSILSNDFNNCPKQNERDFSNLNFTNLLQEAIEKNTIQISDSPDKLSYSDTVIVTNKDQVSNKNNKSNMGIPEVTPKRDLILKKKPLNKKLLSTFNQVSKKDNESKIESLSGEQISSEIENETIDKNICKSINVSSKEKLSKQNLSKNFLDDNQTKKNDETSICNLKENNFPNISSNESMSPLSSSRLKNSKNDFNKEKCPSIHSSREKMKEKVMSDWGSLFENGDEADTQIITREGQKIKCHSLVFLVRCKLLFTELKFIDINSHSIKSVEWKEIPYNVAYKFIVYIYTGKCEILNKSDNMWVPLIKLAQKYKTHALLEYLESLDDSIQKNNKKIGEYTNEPIIKNLDRDQTHEIYSISEPVNQSISTEDRISHNSPAQSFTPRNPDLGISKSVKDVTAMDGSQSPDLFDEDEVDDDLFDCCEEVEDYSNNKTEYKASALEKNKDTTEPNELSKNPKSLNNSTNDNELASPTFNEKHLSMQKLPSPDSEEIMEIEQSPRRKSPLSKEIENKSVITGQQLQSDVENRENNDVIDLTLGSEPESSNSSMGSPNRVPTSPICDNLNKANDIDGKAKEIQISVECNNTDSFNVSSNANSNHRTLNLMEDVETKVSKLKNLNMSSVKKAHTLSFQDASGDVDFFDEDTEDMDPLVFGGDTSNSEADDPVIIERNQENIEEKLLENKSHEETKQILCADDAVDNENNNSFIDNVWDDFDDMGMGCEMAAAYVPSPVKAQNIQVDKINSAECKKNKHEFNSDLEMDDVEADTEESYILKLNDDEDNKEEIYNNTKSVNEFYENHTKEFKECNSNKEESSFRLPEMEDYLVSDGNTNLSGKSSVSDSTLLRAVDDAENFDWNCDLTMAEETRDLKSHTNIEKDGIKTKQKSKKDQLKSPVAPRKKSIQITPRPDYKNMITPELKKELTKYGIRPISKNKAIQLLTHVYEQTHPVVTDSEAETSYCETPPAKPLPPEEKKGGKKNNDNVLRKKVLTKMQQSSTYSSQNAVQKKISNKMQISNKPSSSQSNLEEKEELLNSSQDSDSSNGSDIGCAEETILLPERIEEVNQDDLLTLTQQGDLQSRVSEFIKHDSDLRTKVLLYEPIWIRELQANLKLNGIKCSMAVLMDILDQQCVTFRSEKVQKQGKGRTRKKPK